jgi:hypothetical protein
VLFVIIVSEDKMKGKRMKINIYRNLAALTALALFLSACGGAPTPDVAGAIATSVVQTVEARDTEQAAQQPTETTAPSPTPATTASSTPPATSTSQPLDSNGKPCYAAGFLADVTIPDGKLVTPSEAFTKTWRLRNDGNCVWDKTYSLMLDTGDAMGTVVKVPLSTFVYPEQSVDLSVDLTAPATDGIYTGYWRIATPFGGSFGVGANDQSLIVKIEVSSKPKNDVGVSDLNVGLFERKPKNGCNTGNIAASYTFSAVITANAASTVVYHWNRLPYDGSKPEGGKLKFTEAGSKTVFFTWTLQHESLQTIDRSVSITIDSPGELTSQRIAFRFTCEI